MSIRQILLIDDDPDIRQIAALALVHVGGFAVKAVSSGAEGLAVAQEDRPDLILLDVMMPEMDGPTTLCRLRGDRRTVDIPVIFLTAKARPKERDRYRSLGAVGTIPKPFDPMMLASDIRALVEGRGV